MPGPLFQPECTIDRDEDKITSRLGPVIRSVQSLNRWFPFPFTLACQCHEQRRWQSFRSIGVTELHLFIYTQISTYRRWNGSIPLELMRTVPCPARPPQRSIPFRPSAPARYAGRRSHHGSVERWKNNGFLKLKSFPRVSPHHPLLVSTTLPQGICPLTYILTCQNPVM